MPKKYTISEVMSSQEAQDITVPFKDGEVDLRVEPISYGELQIIMRKQGITATGETGFEMGNELFLTCVKRLEEDENGNIEAKPFSKGDLKKLPPGFVVSVMDRVNDILGLGTPAENLSLLSETPVKEEVSESS